MAQHYSVVYSLENFQSYLVYLIKNIPRCIWVKKLKVCMFSGIKLKYYQHKGIKTAVVASAISSLQCNNQIQWPIMCIIILCLISMCTYLNYIFHNRVKVGGTSNQLATIMEFLTNSTLMFNLDYLATTYNADTIYLYLNRLDVSKHNGSEETQDITFRKGF